MDRVKEKNGKGAYLGNNMSDEACGLIRMSISHDLRFHLK